MRPKVHHNAQRGWQRRAFQYATYAFWPLLFLWLMSSYPNAGSTSGVSRHHPAGTQVGADAVRDGSGSSGKQQQQVELSDTDIAQWEPPKAKEGAATGMGGAGTHLEPATGAGSSSSGGLVQQPGGGGAATAGGTAGAMAEDPNRVYSSATVFAVRNGNGNYTKFYYKFHNVRITKKALYFYMPPGMKRPAEHWVDFVSGNATQPTLPTMIVIKGEVQRQKWFYLPVKYTTAPSKCTAWTNKPTYFMQVRYSYNIWHTWNEGLMGAFQTLREQGLLPLVQVDEHGNMREVSEGLSEECPAVWDEVLNGTRPESECRKRLGVVKEDHCDIKNQPWCRPGVVSYHRFDGPVILPYGAASVMNRWAQMYDAMTTDIRDFSLVDGHCFKTFLVGKTNTLNYYQPVNASAPIQAHIRERVEAMAVFKAFVGTAQREFVAQERAKNPAAVQFRGYANPKMERLRKGIGPEDIDLVEYIAPGEVPGLLREELPQLKQMWAKRRKEIAKIEAAWKAGKDVVSLKADAEEEEEAEDEEEAEEGGNAGAKEQEQEARQQRQRQRDAEGEDGEAKKRRSLREGAAAAAAGKGSSSGARGSGGGSGARGEGGRRRGHRSGGRSLLEQLGVRQAGAAAAEDGAQEELGEEVVAAQEEAERDSQLSSMSSIVPHGDAYVLESPRPVVTYMSRNFFSRGVLNEPDLLRYVLANYNVTLRVTTFEEPLLQAMELLQHTDVIIGMHGAGWTNGMFIKHGAVAMQMYPYGWRLPDNSTIRGYNYREIVLASECKYFEWVSQRWDYAFFRRIDFNRRVKMEYVLHPDPNGPHPVDGWPGNPWIYQNTYVDMKHFGPYIDAAMTAAGIKRVANPRPVTLN